MLDSDGERGGSTCAGSPDLRLRGDVQPYPAGLRKDDDDLFASSLDADGSGTAYCRPDGLSGLELNVPGEEVFVSCAVSLLPTLRKDVVVLGPRRMHGLP
eukprot:160802-Heterocapsa_arctica.AAC.1